MVRILGFILLLSCSAFFFLEAVAFSSHSSGLAGFSVILAIVIFIIGLMLFRRLPLLRPYLHLRLPRATATGQKPRKPFRWNEFSN
jgi:hypothetical protein